SKPTHPQEMRRHFGPHGGGHRQHEFGGQHCRNGIALSLHRYYSISTRSLLGGEGRNRSPQASFLPQKCVILRLSQELHHHYPTQHFLYTLAEVFADSEMPS